MNRQLYHDMSHAWMGNLTHMIEAFHTYEWVMAHIGMGHFTRKNKSCRMHECILMKIEQLGLVALSWHVTQRNGTCHTYERVRSHVWMSHVTRMNSSYHRYEWVMSHSWMESDGIQAARTGSFITTCHTDECVMSHIWIRQSHIQMIHVTHMKESCHAYEWVMSHVWIDSDGNPAKRTGSFIMTSRTASKMLCWRSRLAPKLVRWPMYTCDMTHSSTSRTALKTKSCTFDSYHTYK